MSAKNFIKRQIAQVRQGGRAVLFKKMTLALPTPINLALYILAIPPVVVIRLIKPWLLVRVGALVSTRLGHFAANTELYLCERDAGINRPMQRNVNLFHMTAPICNQQLAIMWRRLLCVWPAWFLAPIVRVNRLIPGGAVHEAGNNRQHDRDVYNLWDRFPPHLQFTDEEHLSGEAGLRAMGIPPGVPFVCLAVRDSAYLAMVGKGIDCSYHNYRDSNIQTYVLAAEELADRGYFVIRMGAKVQSGIDSTHPKVIDYATNGMRSDFMDIYLGAKCAFCISVGTGFDSVSQIFRRPIVFVNTVPIGYLSTFRYQLLAISKHHFAVRHDRELALGEIFTQGVGFSLYASEYASHGVKLIDNTAEEIRDVVIEMAERVNGTWQPHEDDDDLQHRFWEIFPADAVDAFVGRPLHGRIRSRVGAIFLRDNREWLR